MNYAQVKAIENKNKMNWLAVNPRLNEHSGIYILKREEDGFKYAYVGQAKHVLSRLAQHLTGYQHIDLSLKKHGLYDETENKTGWNVVFHECGESLLDASEMYFIKEYANLGYQMRNKTSGSQSDGKFGIAPNKPPKGYRDGLAQGYKNAQCDVAKLFEKNLTFSVNGTPNKNKEKALDRFTEFLKRGG